MLSGPPCNTFSNARKSGEEGPQPLRGAIGSDRYGLRELDHKDKEKVRVGTLLAGRSTEAAAAMDELGKPSITEQPKWRDDGLHVSMYNLDEFDRFKQNSNFEFKDLDQCEHGAPTTKPTTLMLGNIQDEPLRKCSHPKQWWKKPSTGESILAAHPPLKGKEWYIMEKDWRPSMKLTSQEARRRDRDRPYLTSAAQAYPSELNKWLVDTLIKNAPTVEQKSSYVRVGAWRNSLKMQYGEDTAKLDSKMEFAYPLRGKRRLDQEDDETCWGGMRKPGKIATCIASYRAAGHKLWLTLIGILQNDPEMQRRYLQAIGSTEESVGPNDADIRKTEDAINDLFHGQEPEGEGLHTKLKAGLLWKIANAFGDPDGDTIYEWLMEGAPAGISLDIKDPGHIFPASEDYEPQMPDWLPDPESHLNYGSVEWDEAAGPEIQRLLSTGFVKAYQDLNEFRAWLGAEPHLSKMGMITKEKDGRTKRRLILDCKESGVNNKAKKGGKLVLPRVTDAMEDALYLMNKAEPGQEIEWLILAFSNWFFNIPLHPKERQHFTVAY